MFILKSTHRAELKSYIDIVAELRSKCSDVIAAKDDHIAALNEQIDYLKRLSEPRMQGLPTVHVEADAVLSGGGNILYVTEDDHQRQAIQNEAVALLTGTYS